MIVLLVAFGGVLAARLRWLGRAARYLSTFALSFSFLLSLVPGVNETLTLAGASDCCGTDGPGGAARCWPAWWCS